LSEAKSGEFADTSDIDGIAKLYAYRQIGTYPLVVVTSIALDSVYAGWFNKAVRIVAAVLTANASRSRG
jgi:hypothetical protein